MYVPDPYELPAMRNGLTFLEIVNFSRRYEVEGSPELEEVIGFFERNSVIPVCLLELSSLTYPNLRYL